MNSSRQRTRVVACCDSELDVGASIATLLLTSGHPSTRERESLRGWPSVGREQPLGLVSGPEMRLQDGERGGRDGLRTKRRNPLPARDFRTSTQPRPSAGKTPDP